MMVVRDYLRNIGVSGDGIEMQRLANRAARPDLYDFEWPVDLDGYVIVRRGGPGESLLERASYREICGRGGTVRHYRPMSEAPGLWREFAETCNTEESILNFTNRYGLLFAQICSIDEVVRGSAIIGRVASLIDANRHDEAIETFNASAQATLRMRISNKELRPRPASLYGALLIQMGEALTGNHAFKHCANPLCTSWIKVGTGASTSRRKFCSDRCRVATDRLKAKQA